ncbi:unnamed protein product [Protopolystoma xenopodis]|uniref:Uncharacterized protein n=1 Tax=Protopolystoma xenopodis TaxID=117903 RepID=A0A448X6V3_9PLAT|nr:unnamed protein product [Protopolystoma xenopodis]
MAAENSQKLMRRHHKGALAVKKISSPDAYLNSEKCTKPRDVKVSRYGVSHSQKNASDESRRPVLADSDLAKLAGYVQDAFMSETVSGDDDALRYLHAEFELNFDDDDDEDDAIAPCLRPSWHEGRRRSLAVLQPVLFKARHASRVSFSASSMAAFRLSDLKHHDIRQADADTLADGSKRKSSSRSSQKKKVD